MRTELHQGTCCVSLEIQFGIFMEGNKKITQYLHQNSHYTSTFSRQITQNIIQNYEHSLDTPVSEMLHYDPHHNIHKPFLGLQRASHFRECFHVAKSRPGTILSHLLFTHLANYTRVKVFVEYKLQSRLKHDSSQLHSSHEIMQTEGICSCKACIQPVAQRTSCQRKILN